MKKFVYNAKAKFLCLFSDKHVKLAKILLRNAFKIATAESCTGGLLSSRLTDVAGSSAYVRANFVTYSNQSKHDLLGVSPETIERFGAVSEECASEMACGLAKKTGCDIAICTTGVAGPASDEGKAAGRVYISVFYKDLVTVNEYKLCDCYSRKNMKFMFTEKAFEMALNILSGL